VAFVAIWGRVVDYREAVLHRDLFKRVNT
jgi:hypothetical protein